MSWHLGHAKVCNSNPGFSGSIPKSLVTAPHLEADGPFNGIGMWRARFIGRHRYCFAPDGRPIGLSAIDACAGKRGHAAMPQHDVCPKANQIQKSLYGT